MELRTMTEILHQSSGVLKKCLTLFLSAEFFRFLIFGGIAALVNLAVGYTLYSGILVVMPYFWAVLIGSASGLLINFGCNYYFNFHYRGRPMLRQFNTFFVVAGVGVLLNALVAKGLFLAGQALLENGFGLHGLVWRHLELVCHVLSIGIVTFYSFLGHKFCSFNEGIRSFWRRARRKNVLR